MENDIVTINKELGGTTAFLKINDQLKVIDLLYGMMLPSGNDAAYALADFCGERMLKDPLLIKHKPSCNNLSYFIKQMNVVSLKLGFKSTKFLNPHGLSHMANNSSVIEIGKLGAVLMKSLCSQK